MQNGPDVDHIKLGPRATQRQDGLFQPVIQLVALVRVADQLIIFNIIQYGQVRTIRAMTQAAQLFTAAGNLHLDICRRQDGTHLPDAARTAGFRKIHFQTRVPAELRLDGFQHRIRLIDTVHDDDRVFFQLQDDAPQNKELTDDGRFGLTTGSGDGVLLTDGRTNDFRQTLKQELMQLRLIFMADIVREVVLHEVAKAVNRIPDRLTALIDCLLRRVKADLFRLDGPTQRCGQLVELGLKLLFIQADILFTRHWVTPAQPVLLTYVPALHTSAPLSQPAAHRRPP
ncbi:Uncharacterised protein [Klebsiella quasipneumoniae]|nr:Uncharacterised protein [Klebsiella quasipneumoniae]